MEENIQKILQEKDENVVQFNVTNTTPNPVFIDLFDSANLSPVASSLVYSNPPNSIVGTFGFGLYNIGVIINNGFTYYTKFVSNQVDVFDNNYNLITTINAPTTIDNIAYNYYNNTIYLIDGISFLMYVVDINSNTIISTILTPTAIGNSVYNSNSNLIYFTAFASGVWIFNCVTLTFTINIPLNIPYATYFFLAFNPNNNLLYLSDNGVINSLAVIDVLTYTYLPNLLLPIGFGGSRLTLNTETNILFLGDATNSIGLVDCITNTFLSSLIFPIGTQPLQGCFDNFNNQLYFPCGNGNLIIIDGNNNSVISNSSIGTPPFLYCIFNPITNSVLINYFATNSLIQFTTIGITSTPFYITGSANYNAFVNNLNNEPVFIQMVRLLVQNQDQLNNELQLTTIDSNGNQIFMPNFPINQVSAYQQQGNIGEITLKDVVFDGRTYINQYQLNAYESISFEIYYKQLDLTTATPNLPIFFKPKVQLKEYIRKDYNNYDVEM